MLVTRPRSEVLLQSSGTAVRQAGLAASACRAACMASVSTLGSGTLSMPCRTGVPLQEEEWMGECWQQSRQPGW